MYSSEVPSVGECFHVPELGKTYKTLQGASGSCAGCAGHGPTVQHSTVCASMPDCSTRSISLIFKEIA